MSDRDKRNSIDRQDLQDGLDEIALDREETNTLMMTNTTKNIELKFVAGDVNDNCETQIVMEKNVKVNMGFLLSTNLLQLKYQNNHFANFILFRKRNSMEWRKRSWWNMQMIHFGCVYDGFPSFHFALFGLECSLQLLSLL